MKGFDPASSFGPRVAAAYDDNPRGDEEAAAMFLSDLAQGRRALELAIGTGRIALPLAAKGIQVDGIELSAPMVERLRAKPGGDQINVTIGDMSIATTGQHYGLVYLFIIPSLIFSPPTTRSAVSRTLRAISPPVGTLLSRPQCHTLGLPRANQTTCMLNMWA